MYDALTTLVPLLLFMLTPVFIPMVAGVCGAVVDRITAKPVPVRLRPDEGR